MWNEGNEYCYSADWLWSSGSESLLRAVIIMSVAADCESASTGRRHSCAPHAVRRAAISSSRWQLPFPPLSCTVHMHHWSRRVHGERKRSQPERLQCTSSSINRKLSDRSQRDRATRCVFWYVAKRCLHKCSTNRIWESLATGDWPLRFLKTIGNGAIWHFLVVI